MKRLFCRKMLDAVPRSQQVPEKWQPLSSSAQKAQAVAPSSCVLSDRRGTTDMSEAKVIGGFDPHAALGALRYEPTAAKGGGDCEPAAKTEGLPSPSRLLAALPRPPLSVPV